MEKLVIIYPIGFTLILELPKYLESFEFVQDTLYISVRGYEKLGYFLDFFKFSPIYGKI